MNEIINKVKNNMKKITALSNREYLLYQKYYEIQDMKEKFSEKDIVEFKYKLMNYGDLESFINSNNNKIEIIPCDSNNLKNEWKMGKTYISILQGTENPGRCIKFMVNINGKIAGFLSLASDIIALESRDKYIGWGKEEKLTDKKLNNTAICSTIVPTQPLGYMGVGGKLLCLLLFHDSIKNEWENKYNNKLVGLTTTSLFGVNSQYNGMPKYWKTLGETSGKTNLYPQQSVYNKIREWCKETYPEEYWGIWKEHTNKKTGKKYKKSSPKNQVMSLFYKKTNFKKLWKEYSDRSLCVEFKRGIYFAKLYENSIEYLNSNNTENDLILRNNLDFNTNSFEEIEQYWKRKWSIKRFNKKKHDNKDMFLIDDNDCKDVYDFINKYNN